jgi:hypothetical protein
MDPTPAGRYRLPVAPGHGQIRPLSSEASLPLLITPRSVVRCLVGKVQTDLARVLKVTTAPIVGLD